MTCYASQRQHKAVPKKHSTPGPLASQIIQWVPGAGR